MNLRGEERGSLLLKGDSKDTTHKEREKGEEALAFQLRYHFGSHSGVTPARRGKTTALLFNPNSSPLLFHRPEALSVLLPPLRAKACPCPVAEMDG